MNRTEYNYKYRLQSQNIIYRQRNIKEKPWPDPPKGCIWIGLAYIKTALTFIQHLPILKPGVWLTFSEIPEGFVTARFLDFCQKRYFIYELTDDFINKNQQIEKTLWDTIFINKTTDSNNGRILLSEGPMGVLDIPIPRNIDPNYPYHVQPSLSNFRESLQRIMNPAVAHIILS